MYYGVRCAVIHPGFTDTQMVRALGEEHIQKNILPYTQLKRLIDPDEIADAIYFMICNSAVSGELWADAGWHPRADVVKEPIPETAWRRADECKSPCTTRFLSLSVSSVLRSGFFYIL